MHKGYKNMEEMTFQINLISWLDIDKITGKCLGILHINLSLLATLSNISKLTETNNRNLPFMSDT